MSKSKFNFGDKVFAKLKGYCPWPAKIEGIAGSTKRQVKYNVYFYGTKQIGVCWEEDIVPYNENKKRLGKPKTLKYFNTSLEEIEADTEQTPSSFVSEHLVELGTFEHEPISSIQYKLQQQKALLQALKVEVRILEIKAEIENNLGPTKEKTNLELCLKYLEELIDLLRGPNLINSVTIKKHSNLVQFIINLKKYKCDVSEWNLSDEDELLFCSLAESICSKASMAYEKIVSLFHVPQGMRFIDVFNEEMKQFEKDTKGLDETGILSLL